MKLFGIAIKGTTTWTGCGYSPFYANRAGYVTWPSRRMTARFRNAISRLTRDDIIKHPVFRPFDEAWLHSTNNVVSAEQIETVRARILGDGIPATSFAAGVEEIEREGVFLGNINYSSCKDGQWPRAEGEWRHSDIKDVAFRFNYKFFRKLVAEENQ